MRLRSLAWPPRLLFLCPHFPLPPLFRLKYIKDMRIKRRNLQSRLGQTTDMEERAALQKQIDKANEVIDRETKLLENVRKGVFE